MVIRHEVFRTRFISAAGGGHVVVDPPSPCDLSVTAVRVGEVDSFVDNAVKQPFDLAYGQLLRVRVGTVTDHDHVVVISTHHIISDAESKRVLTSEVTALYATFRAGEPNRLAPVRGRRASHSA